MKQALYLCAASALAVMVGFSDDANASVVINGITVTETDSGPVINTLLSPDVAQPNAYSATGAQVQFAWNGSSLSNQGWDPFGPADISHHWWNIGNGGSVGFNLSGNVLNILWGSPNDDNTVTFYSGANGSGSQVGAVTTPNLVSAFSVVDANQPGYLISFTTPVGFESVVFSTGGTAFEFAFTTAVPEPSTWAMMILSFAGIGAMTYRRKSKPALMAA